MNSYSILAKSAVTCFDIFIFGVYHPYYFAHDIEFKIEMNIRYSLLCEFSSAISKE